MDQLELRRERRDSKHIPEKSSAIFAAMSHELRTPMNGVIGMAELLLIADDLDDRHRRRVEIIKRSGETLLSMLDHIIELSRIETEEGDQGTSPFNLLEIARDVHRQFQSKGSVKTIELDLIESSLEIVGDAARFKKLFSYFLNSAAKASANEQIHIVMTAKPGGERTIQIRFEAKNTNIAAESIERILAACGRDDHILPDNFSEAGLGLLVCKRLGQAMGGDVGVDQIAGEDPIFWLEISLSEQTEGIVPEEATIAPVATKVPKDAETAWDVLVAEDNPDMALLIEDFLEEAGYHATVAPDGASVLRILGEQHFDVVLMDGRMPDMSGFETTELIRKLPDERAKIPIIALTAEALVGDRERYLSAGMDEYVAKPVDYETLIDTIERCCNEQQR